MTNPPRVALVSGASSGIGKACAEDLAEHGFKVYGTSRRPLQATKFTALQLDVTDDASVAAGVAQVLQREGRIDVLVNNAGTSVVGAVEDTALAEARAQLETNFFGAVRLSQSVLPIMRVQGGGTIVNVSSIAGLIALPFQAFYSASKFALEGLSEALRYEVAPFGIRVVLIEPGDHQTGLTASRTRAARADAGSPYAKAFESALSVTERDEQAGPPPDAVARVVRRAVNSRSPALRYRVGPFMQRSAVTLKHVLPETAFASIVRSTYKL